MSGHLVDAPRAVRDVGHLVRFRAERLRGARARGGVVLLLAVTLAAATAPAALPGAGDSDRAFEVLVLLPSGYAAFAVLALVNAISSGGGRELLPREHAVAFPVSPTTDHLGALLLSPLTITWLLQAWFVLGATAYASPPGSLLRGEVLAFSWLLAVTAAAQGVGWATEWVRRGPAGLLLTRGVAVLLIAGTALLQVTGNLVALLDSLPTQQLVLAAVSTQAPWWRYATVLAVVLGLFLVAVVAGAFPAHLAARRTPRDELALETAHRPARPLPGSELRALLRVDRASVWRAVPVRRGLVVLAVGPGAVALAGGLPWQSIVILPGLVASGAALLFGVNVWCLDQRGALWRDSLPGLASLALLARGGCSRSSCCWPPA